MVGDSSKQNKANNSFIWFLLRNSYKFSAFKFSNIGVFYLWLDKGPAFITWGGPEEFVIVHIWVLYTPPGMLSFFFGTPPPPSSNLNFSYTPPPPPKKEKRKRRHQLWHYYIAQTNNEFKLRFDCFKSVLTDWLICCQTWSHQSVTWDGRVSSYFWRGHGLNLVSQSNQAQRKLIRVGAAGMGASSLGGLKFSFSKMHISRILWEN